MQTFFDERKRVEEQFDGTPASYTPSLSTSTERALRSGAVWLASEPVEIQDEFLESLARTR